MGRDVHELLDKLETLDTHAVHAELLQAGERHRLLRHVLQAAKRVQQEKRAQRVMSVDVENDYAA